MRIRSTATALLTCILCTVIRADDAPATSQPTAVTAAQLIAVLPKAVGAIPEQQAVEQPDVSGMGIVGCTAHYKLSDSAKEFADVDLSDYGASDFNRTMLNAAVGMGKNLTDAGGTYRPITIKGWPAEEWIAPHADSAMITVVVNKRFAICFHGGLVPEAPLRAAVEAYDFSKLAALGK